MPTRHDYDPTALTAARRREAAKRSGKQTGRGSGLTPRVKLAIDLLVFGDESDLTAVMRLPDASARAQLTPRALRAAMLKPAVDAYYQRQMVALRNGERAASIRTIAAIRDDATLKGNAAGATARLKAAASLAFDPPGAAQVSVQVNTNTTVTPGYMIRLVRDNHIVEHDVDDLPISGGSGRLAAAPHPLPPFGRT